MTNERDTPKHEDEWAAATWQGARREAMRRWAELPVERILAAQEEMAELGKTFGNVGETPASVREPGHDYAGGSGRHELTLAGCQSTPLASYLKALGVLRLVAEQADADARGCWREDRFVLCTRLSEDELVRFFAERYRPTPVLAPWNGGSGFYPKDNQSGIQPIESGAAARLGAFREAIAVARSVLQRQGITQKPEGQSKTDLFEHLRGELSEDALDWLDAAVLLTEEKPKYPPLLGTGGNDGRLDFTNNFMRHLVALIDTETGEPLTETANWLREALFDDATPGLESAAVGQFSPGEAGGPNQISGYSGEALFNSWDFVLMLEGALLFAAAATRRLESAAPGALSYPFMVRPTGAGSGASALGDEDNARAELWAPLWSTPTGLAELRALLAEGRATIDRRPARNGLDFARAVSRLGVDRGITAFQRYAFLMRSGKAFFATPLNRLRVQRNPAADLIDNLDESNWLSLFRRLARDKHASHRVQSLARRLEDAVFLLTVTRQNPASAIERLLMLLGEAQQYLAHSPAAREKCPPVPSLSGQWLTRIDAEGGAIEIELAAALAGLHGVAARPSDRDRDDWVMPMRAHLAPDRGGRYPAWDDNAGHEVTWGRGSLAANLAALTSRRLLDAERLDLRDKPFHPARVASLASVAAWLAGAVDQRRLVALLPGLMLVRIPGGGNTHRERQYPLPAAYRVLKPFFCLNKQLQETRVIAADRTLSLPGTLLRKLATNDVNAAVEQALRRLRAADVSVRWRRVDAGTVDGRTLLAALLVPIANHDVEKLLRQPKLRQSPEEHQ